MENDKFDKAKQLKSEIDQLETKKYRIERLLNCSCGVGATITGTPKGTFNNKVEVYCRDSDAVKLLLKTELEQTQKDLNKLITEFNEL